MSKFACRSLLIFASIVTFACAHRPADDDTPDVAAAPTPARAKVKTKIKYVYVESPSTTSAMTTAPFEPPEAPASSFSLQVVQILWPLLAMMATGLVFILILLGEHLILNRQLARRSRLRAQLREA